MTDLLVESVLIQGRTQKRRIPRTVRSGLSGGRKIRLVRVCVHDCSDCVDVQVGVSDEMYKACLNRRVEERRWAVEGCSFTRGLEIWVNK